MPRSGTTLTEQILASHPQVQAAGELPTLGRLAQRWSARPRPTASIPEHSPPPKRTNSPRATSTPSRRSHPRPSAPPTRCRITLITTGEHLWLIALLFPNATVLHCQRDPLATCWSIYTHNFATGHAYADDLLTLGAHYRDYQTLMAHWQQELPIPIHSVRYEALVRDPEPHIRALLEHCRLDFHPACLTPHQTQRAVRTASAAQASQPLTTPKRLSAGGAMRGCCRGWRGVRAWERV